MSEHRKRYNLNDFLIILNGNLRYPIVACFGYRRIWCVKTEEDSKDGAMKFFQTREKKKRKNSIFGTYTLIIQQWLRFFSSWKATKHLFGCLCLAPGRKRSRSSHFQLIRLRLRRCNTQPCCILWIEYNLDSIKGRQMRYENNPK